MNRTCVVKWLLGLGYIGLAGCGVPQWLHMLTSRDVAGVSLPFLAVYVASLALLQVAFVVGRFGWAVVLGNFAGLCNVAMCLGLYLALTAGS